jgi:hypothetical protein
MATNANQLGQKLDRALFDVILDIHVGIIATSEVLCKSNGFVIRL